MKANIDIIFSRGDDIGGVQRFAINLGEELSDRGYKVKLVYGGAEDKIRDLSKLDGEFIEGANRVSIFRFARFLSKQSDSSVRILNSTAIGLAGALCKSNSIFVFHGLASNFRRGVYRILLLRVESFISKRLKYCVYLKESDRSRLKDNKGHIIPNYVDADHFLPSKTRGRDAVIVARHSKQKLMKEMLLFCVNSGFRSVVVLGDGPQYDENVTYFQGLAGADALDYEFLKFVANPEKIYADSKYFIQFSVSEGMSLAVLEAMSCGCNVLVNSYDGADQLVENGITGYIVDISAPKKDLTYSIEMGLAARDYVKKNHGKEKFLESYMRLIDELEKKTGTPS